MQGHITSCYGCGLLMTIMSQCAVYGCTNTHKNSGASFFKFPTNSKLRKEWTLQIKRTRDKWTGPTNHTCVCSDHFTEDCFMLQTIIAQKLGLKRQRKLNPDAVPTIIERPSLGSPAPKRLRTSKAYEKRERARVSTIIIVPCLL